MILDNRGCSVATTEAAPRGSPAGLTLVHKRYLTVCEQAQAWHAEDAAVIETAAFAATDGIGANSRMKRAITSI